MHAATFPSARRRWSRIVVTLVACAVALSLPVSVGPARAADPTGCGYGSGGPGASTICWIDLAGLDPQLAHTAAGQPMTIDLGNGVQLHFTARLADGADGFRDFTTTSLPTWSGAALGNTAYTGVSGEPALYQVDGRDGGWLGSLSLDDIVVTSNGAPQSAGYALVMADAEATSEDEGFRFESTSPIELLAEIDPPTAGAPAACSGGLTGLGSTTVECFGTLFGAAGAAVFSTDAPTSVTGAFHNDTTPGTNTTRQGMAFGVMFARVQVTKEVPRRYQEADQFHVSAAVDDNVLAAATTAGSDTTVSTDQTTILTSTDGTTVTFREQLVPSDTDGAHYAASWSCTRNDEAIDPGDLEIAPDTRSVSVEVYVGDFVHCTVRNDALLGSLSWTKDDGDGRLLAGSAWQLTGDGITLTIADGGENDDDPSDGALLLSGIPWGDYSLIETAAPTGYVLLEDPVQVTIGPEQLDVQLEGITNQLGTPGITIIKTADPVDGSVVAPGSVVTYTVQAQNTGNVDLTPASILDDMRDVLDDADYVDGSATAAITAVADVPVPIVSTASGTLSWEGPLLVGQTVTLRYQVRVADDFGTGDQLLNVVTGGGSVPPGFPPPVSNCVPETAASNPDCSTTHVPPTGTTPPPENPTTPSSPPAASPPPELAHTGVAWSPLLALGALLTIALGLALTTRRRRSE